MYHFWVILEIEIEGKSVEPIDTTYVEVDNPGQFQQKVNIRMDELYAKFAKTFPKKKIEISFKQAIPAG